MSYEFLLDIALILLSTKVLGLFVKRYHMPQVVGALLAGLILGPAVLNILEETDFIKQMAELGVIVLMFSAGMETDISELKKTGKTGFIVALFGVLVPLVMGAGLMFFFNKEGLSSDIWLQNIFVGVVLTATSVSITVETLKEMGKLSTKVGNTILAASLIDDILGLIALTVITSMAGTDINVWWVLGKIALFFVFSGVMSYVSYLGFKWYGNKVQNKDLRRFPVMAFVFCLVMAYSAEHLFGVADIMGAFVAGLVIANTSKSKYIASKFNPLSFLLLSPIFFASIGISVVLPDMNWSIILFTILLTLIAIISKLFGCGLGAKLCKFSSKEGAQVGFGMACRGEVSLIVANKGVAIGILSASFFGPIIIMVVVTTILTPIILKIMFKDDEHEIHESELIENYEKINKVDYIDQKLLHQD